MGGGSSVLINPRRHALVFSPTVAATLNVDVEKTISAIKAPQDTADSFDDNRRKLNPKVDEMFYKRMTMSCAVEYGLALWEACDKDRYGMISHNDFQSIVSEVVSSYALPGENVEVVCTKILRSILHETGLKRMHWYEVKLLILAICAHYSNSHPDEKSLI